MPHSHPGPTTLSYYSQDIGFGWSDGDPALATDINVVNRYFDEFFPAAVAVAAALRERDG
jgi:hypothetical protein